MDCNVSNIQYQIGSLNCYIQIASMSQFDNTMSMNSLMDAIYGIQHPPTPNSSYENSHDQTTSDKYFCETQHMLRHNKNQINCDQLPSFLQSLLKYLKELCLTQKASEIALNKLQPIIYQLSMTLNVDNNSPDEADSLEQSGVAYAFAKQPKTIIAEFFQEYIHLLQQQAKKFQKYSPKKLRYLTDTVNKQIFSEIMRMACDLKLSSLCQENQLRAKSMHRAHLKLLTNIMNHVVVAKHLEPSYQVLKLAYHRSIKQQESLMSSLEQKFSQVNDIAHSKYRRSLRKVLNLWRINTKILDLQEEVEIHSQMQSFISSALPDVIEQWKRDPRAWPFVACSHLKELLETSFSHEEGIQISFEINPQLCRSESEHSLEYSLESETPQICDSHLDFQLKEVKYRVDKCEVQLPFRLQSQQACYGVVVMRWVETLPFLIFNRMLYMLETCGNLLEEIWKISKRLEYYLDEHKLGQWQVRAYDMHLGTQQKHHAANDCNACQDVDRTCKVDTIQTYESDKIKQVSQLEIITQENLSSELTQSESLELLFQSSGMLLMEIYHSGELEPCIHFHHKRLAEPPNTSLEAHIVREIRKKLQSTDSFVLRRDQNSYIVRRIQGDGFCRCLFAGSHDSSAGIERTLQFPQKSNNEIKRSNQIIDCIVPLALRNLGTVGCRTCGVEVTNRNISPVMEHPFSIVHRLQTLPHMGDESELDSKNYSQNISEGCRSTETQITDLMQLMQCRSIDQLQKQVYHIFSNSPYKLFVRLFYRLQLQSCSDRHLYIQNWVTEQCSTVIVPKTLRLGQTYHYSCNQKLEVFANIVKTVQSNPLFANYTLHIYEQQKINQFVLLPHAITNSGCLLLIGTYDSTVLSDSQFGRDVDRMTEIISSNKNLFNKSDIYQWAVSQIQANLSCKLAMPNLPSKEQDFDEQVLEKSLAVCYESKSFRFSMQQVLEMLLRELKISGQFMLWKVRSKDNKLRAVTNNARNVTELPEIDGLLEHPMHSHQQVVGSHFLLGHSQIYVPKLLEKLSYIPTIGNKDIRKLFAQYVLLESQSGETTSKICSFLSQLLQKHGMIDSATNFISLPLATPSRYLLLLTYDKNACKIPHSSFVAIANYLTQLVTQILVLRQSRSKLLIKHYISINPHFPLFQREVPHSTIRWALTQFGHNSRVMKVKLCSFVEKCEVLMHKVKHRNVKCAFIDKIKSQHINRRERLRNAVHYLVAGKLIKIFGFTALFQVVERKKIKMKAISILSEQLNRIVVHRYSSQLLSVKQCFNTVKLFSEHKQIQKQRSIAEGIQRLRKWTSNLTTKNCQQVFDRDCRNKAELQRRFELFKQEFVILSKDIGSYKACINLLQRKLELLLEFDFQSLQKGGKRNWEISVIVMKGDLRINAELGGNCSSFNEYLTKQYYNQNGVIIDNTSFIIMLRKNIGHPNSSESQVAIDGISQPSSTNGFTSYHKKLIGTNVGQVLRLWEHAHIRENQRKIKILVRNLTRYQQTNLYKAFAVNAHCVSKENTRSLKSMQQNSQQLHELIEQHRAKEYVKNNSRNKQTHKIEMEESKKKLSSLQSQAYKLSIEETIKRKTNSMYRILRYISNNKENQHEPSNNVDEIEELYQQAYCESIPLFVSILGRLVNSKTQQLKKAAIFAIL